VFDGESSPLLDVLATKYRTKRSFLDGFTKLHIFVTTLRWNTRAFTAKYLARLQTGNDSTCRQKRLIVLWT
jgi:hypothetical protein